MIKNIFKKFFVNTRKSCKNSKRKMNEKLKAN